MKLQHLAIVFVIIILPISMVMASYIQNQITAIEMQTALDNSLINATYGAVQAFQINTTNNKYSSISDSKIRDIEAAVTTFYTTLLTSMDNRYALSTSDLQEYVPALLFTLYDGYYIYSSYDNVYSTEGEGETEKVTITLDGNNYQYGLKPYVYYSAKYRLDNGNIIVVNYTLDNEITVYGDFGGNDGYVTKSGYLINPDLVTNVDEGNHTLRYDGVLIEPEELTEHLITIENQETGETKADDYRYIFYQNQKIYQDQENGTPLYNEDGTPRIFWYENYIKTYVNDSTIREYARDCNMLSTSAFDYYYEAREFSLWARDNLGGIDQGDTIRNEDGVTPIGDDTEYLAENTGNDKIFYADEDNDPMLSSSSFNNHRIAVIRKSIETNLSTVIANYSSTSLYDYAMPVMGDDEWYKILNNVSLVSFMQGMSIGYRYYNNYAVITNNVNKEVVTAENIYVVVKNEGTNEREYHKPGCEELIEGVLDGSMEIIGSYPTASFQRQTCRVTEADERHYYLQACGGDTLTGCYNCIVNATAEYDADDIIDGTIEHYEDENNILYTENQIEEIRTSYLKALARERYDLYKSNFDLSDLGSTGED